MGAVRMVGPRGCPITVDESSVESMTKAGFRRVKAAAKPAEKTDDKPAAKRKSS